MESVALTNELTLLRLDHFQAYLWDDGDSRTLIDTGLPGFGPDIATAAPGIDRIVLTHGHIDHYGSAADLRERCGAAVLAGAGDAAAIRGDEPIAPPDLLDWERPLWEDVSAPLQQIEFPATPVDVELHGGEELDFGGGAQVVAIPGHTEGSVAVHLPRYGVLFAGDTVANVGELMLGVFNQDRTRTIASLRALAELDADTVCVGHGDPIVGGAAPRLRAVARAL